MPTSLFETFLMMCRSTSALSPVVSMQFSPNYLITMTAHIARGLVMRKREKRVMMI